MQPLPPEPLLSEEDYGAIETAVMETARGRWFLAEYARRNRNADTDAVLAAIRRLERLVQSAGSFEARDEVTKGMADIAQAIAAVRIAPAVIGNASEANPPEAAAACVPAVEASSEASADDEAAFELGLIPEFQEPTPEEISKALAEGAVEQAATTEQGAPVESPTPELSSTDGPAMTIPSDAMAGSREEQAVPAGKDISQAEPQTTAVDVGQSPEPVELALDAARQAEPVRTGETAAIEKIVQTSENRLPEPFLIIELDEEATEALLTQDPPRQELILPLNHLVAQRWNRDFATPEAPHEPSLQSVPSAEPSPSGLVTFIDEEPAEDSESVFSAPLRLEPEDALEPEEISNARGDVEVEKIPEGERTREMKEETGQAVLEEVMAVPAIIAPRKPTPLRMTVNDIEAMPFMKRAALFS